MVYRVIFFIFSKTKAGLYYLNYGIIKLGKDRFKHTIFKIAESAWIKSIDLAPASARLCLVSTIPSAPPTVNRQSR
jgi:hypothetical protein